jgi:hypothetical protein
MNYLAFANNELRFSPQNASLCVFCGYSSTSRKTPGCCIDRDFAMGRIADTPPASPLPLPLIVIPKGFAVAFVFHLHSAETPFNRKTLESAKARLHISIWRTLVGTIDHKINRAKSPTCDLRGVEPPSKPPRS